jgi:hypothetical protein
VVHRAPCTVWWCVVVVRAWWFAVYKAKEAPAIIAPAAPRPRPPPAQPATRQPTADRENEDRKQKTANPARLTAAQSITARHSPPAANTGQRTREDRRPQAPAKRKAAPAAPVKVKCQPIARLRHSLFNNSRSRFVRAILLQLRELTNPEPP